jgi:uncharacterized protein (TIRG00374 family)
MIPEKRVLMRRTLPFLLVGLLVFIVYLYFFVNIHEMIATVKGINLFYYSLAVVVLLLNMLFSAIIWQYFLRSLSINVPFRRTLLFDFIGSFVDTLIPAEAISGDASRAYLMSKESSKNPGKVVASLVGDRILSMIITLSSLIIASTSLFITRYRLPSFVLNFILLVVIGITISLVFIFLVCLKEELTQKIIDSLLRFCNFLLRGRLKIGSLRSKIRKALRDFHQSVEFLGGNPKSLVWPAVFSAIAWLLSVLLSFLVFVSLNHPVSFNAILIVYSISCTVQTLPLGTPAVGLMEIIITSLYAMLGVPLGISAAATVLTRVITVWLRFFIGFVAFQWVGIKVSVGRSR